ncbi:MAG: TetR/AcrR family transcriptional regulator, partial [Pseudomonadota bacterium]
LEKISMREVARRLGVSHQAPYKHFASRDHVLAAIIAQAYDDFAAHLEARSRVAGADDPHEELRRMGEAYFEYAAAHPLQYRLMFNTALPDPATHPAMMAKADRCYALLRESVAKLEHVKAAKAPKKQGELDALFIWTAIHGLASALQSDTIDVIGLSPTTLRAAAPHLLNRIGDAMAVAGIGGGDGDDEANDAGP